ncbi:hypothetical protein [Marinicellulosiphila megalodicopiae]|uniref:hypothetical protein n=1 Tax=Marinicellulosiphila megalodicopiae TaxID=2724896 RepID=UPI003BB02376
MTKTAETSLKFKYADTSFIGSKEEESLVERTLTSRTRLRDEMEADIEAFINGGGEIQLVAKNMRTDIPKKPQSNYGARPI